MRKSSHLLQILFSPALISSLDYVTVNNLTINRHVKVMYIFLRTKGGYQGREIVTDKFINYVEKRLVEVAERENYTKWVSESFCYFFSADANTSRSELCLHSISCVCDAIKAS
jgi:hypothetical protein